VRGPLDRNGKVGWIVCIVLYYSWLLKDFVLNTGYYKVVSASLEEVLTELRTDYRDRGLSAMGKLDNFGAFGSLFLTIKDKDVTLLAKRRPIHPSFSLYSRICSNRVGRGIRFLITQVTGHFNLWSTMRIKEACAEITNTVGKGRGLLGMGFDVKNMFTELLHVIIIRAVFTLISVVRAKRRSLGDTSDSLQMTVRGRGGVDFYVPGRLRRTHVTVTYALLLSAVEFGLSHIYGWVGNILVRQLQGIGMGGSDSPALAECVTVYAEREWRLALGRDSKLVHGFRIMDDVNLFVEYTLGNPQSLARAERLLESFLTHCYPEGVTLEVTSEGDSWMFCGLELIVTSQEGHSGISVRQTFNNTESGVVDSNMQRLFFPLSHCSSCTDPVHQQATIISTLYRIHHHTSCPEDMMRAVAEGWRDMSAAGYTLSSLLRAVAVLAVRFGSVWSALREAANGLP
jgi:hypothetical protein